jgi:hypothetical protein
VGGAETFLFVIREESLKSSVVACGIHLGGTFQRHSTAVQRDLDVGSVVAWASRENNIFLG